MAPAAADITGLILAGGAGRRMGGRDKGWVEYRGQPLIEHVVARLRPQVASLIVSANRNVDRYRALRQVAAVVSDERSGFQGPLAGVLAGLAAAQTQFVALAPCDAPALPLDLVARLAEAIGARAVACPRSGDTLQPTFALLRSAALPQLDACFARGERSLRRAFAEAGTVAVEFDSAGAFANINAMDGIDG